MRNSGESVLLWDLRGSHTIHFFHLSVLILVGFLITLPLTHQLPMLHHRSTWRWTLKEDVTNDRSFSGNSYLLKCHNPLHILTSIWSLRVEGPSEGDGIDLSRDSGSINKQQASGFKAEETSLFQLEGLHLDTWGRTWLETYFPLWTHRGASSFMKTKPLRYSTLLLALRNRSHQRK